MGEVDVHIEASVPRDRLDHMVKEVEARRDRAVPARTIVHAHLGQRLARLAAHGHAARPLQLDTHAAERLRLALTHRCTSFPKYRLATRQPINSYDRKTARVARRVRTCGQRRRYG